MAVQYPEQQMDGQHLLGIVSLERLILQVAWCTGPISWQESRVVTGQSVRQL